jgi:tetratricopeptide (TPR) repeat protein
MKKSKLVGDILVNMDYQSEQSPRSCFVVFSSREAHVDIVMDCIDSVFQESGQFEVARLDQHLKSGDSQYGELTEHLASCCFAVVVLDGFRPNVLFEYGILAGLRKPCIVLVEEKATVDVPGFFSPAIQDMPPSPMIDMDKQFSDVKDRYYLRYNRNKPKQIRSLLEDAYQKLAGQIESEFRDSMFPHKEIVTSELQAHLTTIVDIFTADQDALKGDEKGALARANTHVTRIAKTHNVLLPSRYFSTLARAYAKLRATDRAVKTIDEGLSGTSDDIVLLSAKAYVLRSNGEDEDALRALDDAIELRDDIESLWHNRGITLEKLDRHEEAVTCYEKAIALDAGCAMLHYHYGIALYERKDFAAADSEFTKAIQIRPVDTTFRLWKARTLHSLGQLPEARKLIDAILTTDPANANAWFVLGRFEKDSATALEYFQKAVQLNPNHGGALCSSAAELSNLGRLQEALDIFSEMDKTCYRHESCPTLNSNITATLCKQGRAQDAVSAAEKFLARNPGNPAGLHAKARGHTRLGQYAIAQDIFGKLIASTPDDAELIYNQACAYALAKKYSTAVTCLQRAIDLDSKWSTSAKHDADFSSLRRTKVYRTAFPAKSRTRCGTTSKKKTSRKKTSRPT